MHIPEGYLSPSTTVALYAATAPFWYIAGKRVKKMLSMRMVPLLSVFAAFSFIIMMFNLPLPGGTTGHATGAAIAAIVLGPWGSILAVSIALAIQAIFFGDGGILAIGANSFNIAVVGSFVAIWVYNAVSGKSALTSPRRVIAAGLAGYLAINAAAFVTALQFGVQPLWFTDANGAPLYAPYGLDVAIPAMMIGHIGIAGLAEMFITAGVVAYLQRSDVALLSLTAQKDAEAKVDGTWAGTRRLWVMIAIMMILSPLGLIAAGTAWGEWGAEEFADPAARQAITEASLGAEPPVSSTPAGLESLGSWFEAPIPDYAVPFISHEAVGYIFSAVMGTGLVMLCFLLYGAIADRFRKNNGATN
ncbi:MAG: cobalt transporter CbiM [Chloroflexota bacterium]|jgi:cobalt/nickel transport system permease protein